MAGRCGGRPCARRECERAREAGGRAAAVERRPRASGEGGGNPKLPPRGPASLAGLQPGASQAAAAALDSRGTWAATPHERQQRGRRWRRRRAGSEPELRRGAAAARELSSGARREGRGLGPARWDLSSTRRLRGLDHCHHRLPGPGIGLLVPDRSDAGVPPPLRAGCGAQARPCQPWDAPLHPQPACARPRPRISGVLAAPLGDPSGLKLQGGGPRPEVESPANSSFGYKLSSLRHRRPDASPGRLAVGGGRR